MSVLPNRSMEENKTWGPLSSKINSSPLNFSSPWLSFRSNSRSILEVVDAYRKLSNTSPGPIRMIPLRQHLITLEKLSFPRGGFRKAHSIRTGYRHVPKHLYSLFRQEPYSLFCLWHPHFLLCKRQTDPVQCLCCVAQSIYDR